MKKAAIIGVLLTVAGLAPRMLALQNPPAAGAPGQGGGRRGGAGFGQGPPMVQIDKVRDNLYMLSGGGGNSAVFVTDSGVILVDANLPNYGPVMMEKIRTVTDKPVTTIIITHPHADHTGSIEFFGPNVQVIAHENAKASMAKMPTFQGDKAAFLPSRTYKDTLTLGSGKDEVDLIHPGNSHTNGDTWVVFKALHVLHSGDAFPGKMTPIVDVANGGSALEYGRTLTRVASMIDVDIIITGHSPRMTPVDMKAYAELNSDFVKWTDAEKKAGKSVDDAAGEYKLPAGYTANPFFGGIKGWIQTTYNELDKK